MNTPAYIGFRSVSILFAFACGISAQVSDTTPPSIVSLTFAPTSIDTSLQPQTVTVTARITDDLSGFSWGYVYFFPPSGQASPVYSYFERTSGTALDGMYRAVVTFPRYVAAGTWRLSFISLIDTVLNYTQMNDAVIDSRGFQRNVNVSSTPDTAAPLPAAITFSASVVDVSAGRQPITIDLDLTDNLSGVDFGACDCVFFAMRLISPSGNRELVLSNRDFQRVGGTNLSGRWRVALEIPQHAEPGTWLLNDLYLDDTAKNRRRFSTADLQALNLSRSVAVTSSAPDLIPPQITGLSFSSGFIDTGATSQQITLTVNATDNLSGLSFAPDTPNIARYNTAIFRSPSGQQFRYMGPWNVSNVAGSPLAGAWQGTFFFPRYSEAGTWNLHSLTLMDSARNVLNLSGADLLARGFATNLDVTQPSYSVDGSVPGPVGGTVTDQVFGPRARIVVPPGVLSRPTNISIDVLQTELSLPVPTGYSVRATPFVNINLEPHPTGLLPAPGLTVTLPVPAGTVPAGRRLQLFRAAPNLVPAVTWDRQLVFGDVSADGLSVTFTGVGSLSTVVALVPLAGSVPGDVNGDRLVNCTDVSLIRAAFGKRRGQAGYNFAADVNNDAVIDIKDLAFVMQRLPAGTICQ